MLKYILLQVVYCGMVHNFLNDALLDGRIPIYEVWHFVAFSRVYSQCFTEISTFQHFTGSENFSGPAHSIRQRRLYTDYATFLKNGFKQIAPLENYLVAK